MLILCGSATESIKIQKQNVTIKFQFKRYPIMSNINFAAYVVRDSNGSVDYEATSNKFLNELGAWDTKQGCDVPAITAAIHSVYDRLSVIRINKPALLSYVLVELQVSPTAYKEISARVELVLKSDPCFETTKGKNGGITRVSKKAPEQVTAVH
jgi:hypothetical protein